MSTQQFPGVDKPTQTVALIGAQTASGQELATAQGQSLLLAAIGSPTDAAWDGVASSATLIAIAKRIALNTQVA